MTPADSDSGRRGGRRTLGLFVLFAALVVATRLPLIPGQLFSFDDVNFAYAIGEFDVRKSQPHPPGYPLFVLESRLLFLLGFKRPESNLAALSLAGSAAAVFLLARAARPILGGAASLSAAWLLLFNHVFWYCGLTSAVRAHLAAGSIAVAAACWKAWSGDRRWAVWSSLALGVAAGVRPELGVVLLPLWAASVFRAGGWRDRFRAAAVLTVSVLVWLLPTMAASGGIATYWRLCWEYLGDQATLTSGLFGATGSRWLATVAWVLVWTFSGVLAWPLPAALAWSRRAALFGLTRSEWLFLALWFLPAFLFAIFVHVADAGQTAHLIPVVCLLGGRLIARALEQMKSAASQWYPLIFLLAPVVFALLFSWLWPRQMLLAIPVLCFACGLTMRWLQRTSAGVDRPQAAIFLLAPALFLNALIFFQPVWYYKGPPADGWRAVVEDVFDHLHSGLSFSSLQQVNGTLWVDDRTLRTLGDVSAAPPRETVVLWERGLTSWRKAAYYFPRLPVVVLDHKKLSSESPPTVTVRRGPAIERRLEGPAPLRIDVPAGARLIWMVHPRQEFLPLVGQAFTLRDADPLYYHDLPMGNGRALLGDYLLVW